MNVAFERKVKIRGFFFFFEPRPNIMSALAEIGQNRFYLLEVGE